MPFDTHTKHTITHTISKIKKTSPKLDVRELLCSKKQMIPSYFYDNNMVLTKEDSSIFIAALEKVKFITENKLLAYDPRHSDWKEVETIINFYC